MHKLIPLAILLGACSARPVSPGAAITPTQPASPSRTPTSTQVVPPTATLTTADAIFPYTIDGLRAHKFLSGAVHIRTELIQTEYFTRYLIDYPSDGLTITGILQIPRQGQPPFPVIVMNHGYFYRADYSSGDGTDRAAEYFNRHGYLTISSDYRSWGDSDVGPSLFYSGLAIDVVNLINAIPSIPEADASRMGMWGHSMGGGVTIKVLAIDSRVRAAVLYSTVSADDADVIARWGAGCIGDVFEGELLYGCNSSDILPPDLPADLIAAYQQAAYDPGLLREISAIYHLKYITTPIQIGYGTSDGELLNGTPPEWSRKLHSALRAAGRDSELFAYENERHSFVGDEWVAFMERSAHFFDIFLK